MNNKTNKPTRRSLKRHLLEREAKLEQAIIDAKELRDANPDDEWYADRVDTARTEWCVVYDIICDYFGGTTPPGGWL